MPKMLYRFPSNSLLKIISPYSKNISNSRPLEFITKTNIYNIFSIETIFNEKYLDIESYNNLKFINSINNKLIINKGYSHTQTNYRLSSNIELELDLSNNNNKIKLFEYINIDIRTNQSTIMNYKLVINKDNVLKFTNNNYAEDYKVLYDEEVLNIFDKIKKELENK